MELCNAVALDMPSKFVLMNEEEMTYTEGGGKVGVKIGSNSFIISILSAVGGTLTVAKATAALTAAGAAIATRCRTWNGGNRNLICRCIYHCMGSNRSDYRGCSGNIRN